MKPEKRRRMREIVFRDFGTFGETAVLRAAGQQLGMPYCALVQMAVTDTMPDGTATLLLRKRTDDSYRVVPADEADMPDWRGFLPAPDGKKAGIRWQLAVLEMTVVPDRRRPDAETSEV